MVWHPITEHELAPQVQQAVEQMAEDVRSKFVSIQIPMQKLACRRSGQYGDELLIAVARSGNRVIVFDDVEDEFAVANLPVNTGEALSDWELVGTLENAMMAI
jgi:hypothetical protein